MNNKRPLECSYCVGNSKGCRSCARDRLKTKSVFCITNRKIAGRTSSPAHSQGSHLASSESEGSGGWAQGRRGAGQPVTVQAPRGPVGSVKSSSSHQRCWSGKAGKLLAWPGRGGGSPADPRLQPAPEQGEKGEGHSRTGRALPGACCTRMPRTGACCMVLFPPTTA